MKNSYLKGIYIFLLVLMVQVYMFSGTSVTHAETYLCNNLPLNDGMVYDCGNSPLNAGGTPGHYEGGTVCSPYDVTICNICGNNYYSSACPHSSGTTYGGTTCSPYSSTTTYCNICGNNYYSSACPHYSGQTYNGVVCSPYSSTTTYCNICGNNYYSSACPHTSGTTYGGTTCSPYTVKYCNICGNPYSGCPHVSGTTYGATWVPGTPNTYHLHDSSCAYHYTTHTHTSACPVQTPAVFEITSPASEGGSYTKSDMYVTWSAKSGATYNISMRDTTANMLVFSGISTGSSTSYTIPSKYFYEGHNYRIAVKSTAGSTVEWAERNFKISLSSARETILSRGSSLINYSWTAADSVRGWRNNFTFSAGNTYSGIPYSQTEYQSSISSVSWSYGSYFDTAKNSSTSGFYDDYTRFEIVMPKYGNDCSGYVSICWNISRNTTHTLIGFTRVGDTSEPMLKQYACMSPGDAFVVNASDIAHTLCVKSIEAVNDANGNMVNLLFTCYEQTPYYCRVTAHYANDLIEDGYVAICKNSSLAQDYTWDWQ